MAYFSEEAGGDWLEAAGQNFLEVVNVRLGPNEVLDLVVDSRDRLLFRIPPWTPATSRAADLVVTTIRGEGRLRAAVIYVAPPALRVDSVAPAKALTTGGEAIVISGDEFLGWDIAAVHLVPAEGPALFLPFVVDSDNQITATTVFAPEGVYSIRVVADDGSAASLADAVRLVRPIVYAASVEPAHGSMAGGYVVTLRRGEDSLAFGDVVDVDLNLGAMSVAFTVVDDDTIEFTMPSIGDLAAFASEPFPIRLSTAAGLPSVGPESSFTFDAVGVTFVEPDVAYYFAAVSLHGTSLDSVVDIEIDGASVFGWTIVSDALITLDAPDYSGTVPVLLTAANGDTASAELVYPP